MTELNIKIPGFTIAAKTWGKPENPPILALHGWLDNANSFAPLAPYLENDFYLIAIDFPGHGLSSHLPEGCYYHFFDGIFTLLELIKALQLEKIHVLGHSMGACIASLLAGVAPKQILSLYLIEALGPFSAPSESAAKQLSDYAHFLIHKHHKKSKGYNAFEHAVLARAQKGYVSLDIAQRLCERGLFEQDGRFYWRHDTRLMTPTPLRMTEEQVLSCLRGIEAKTHLLIAENGFSFDEAIMRNRIKSVKNIVLEQIHGGHHIHMEDPKEVGKLLIQFYTK